MQSKLFSVRKILNINGKLVDLSVPHVMGILNITPDSFYDGKRFLDPDIALRQAEKMLGEGADFIDVGGCSTRPGAEDVSEEEEKRRVLNVIRSIADRFPNAIISIDTYRAVVARQAIEHGAHMINDISGGGMDPGMFQTVASLKVPYVLMHMRGTPKTMSQMTTYDNLILDLRHYFNEKLNILHQLSVADIIIDPGFGFAKTISQNFQILKNLDYLHFLGRPLLIGLSRKSMIWKTLQTTPDHSSHGTTTLQTLALVKGASIIRCHDVKEAKETIRLLEQLDS